MSEQMITVIMTQLRILSGAIVQLDTKELTTVSAWLAQAINNLPVDYISRGGNNE